MDSHNKTYFSLFYTPIMDSQKLLVDNVKDNKFTLQVSIVLSYANLNILIKLIFQCIDLALNRRCIQYSANDKWTDKWQMTIWKKRNVN